MMPGRICAVAVCKNNQLALKKQGSSIVFHSFPKGKDLVSSKIQKEWVHRCRRKDKFNIDYSTVCSDHFTVSDYERDLQHELLNSINTVLIVKKVNPLVHQPFVSALGKCIEQIWGYKQLVAEVEHLKRIQFDSDDIDHETKLYTLWENLMPREQLDGRITKKWQDIGFQGEDPKTDFRGMGMLGLDNLLFFATEYRSAAQYLLSHSMHPTYGYCFAIVGINLTSMAWELLKDGSAKIFFYNTSRSLPTIRLFHVFYSHIFCEFDKFWIASKPRDIMEFSKVRDRFERNIRVSLQHPSAKFSTVLTVDTV